MTKKEILSNLIDLGFAILPVSIRKDGSIAPKFENWQLKKQLTKDNLGNYLNHNGWGIVTGSLSNNVEVIDFDEKHQKGIFKEWKDLLPDSAKELLDKLTVTQSKSGGYHVAYISPVLEGNKKLANLCIAGKKTESLIETRGEGGFSFEVPTTNCKVLQGSFGSLKKITEEERAILFDTARKLDQKPTLNKELIKKPITVSPYQEKDMSKPWIEFESKVNWSDILIPHGWEVVGNKGDETFWKRPGKDGNGISATTNWKGNDLFHIFSTSTNFDTDGTNTGKSYTKFQVYTNLNFNGDFQKSARELIKIGYGKKFNSVRDITKEVIEKEFGLTKTETNTDCLEFLNANDIEPVPIEWLWEERIAKGKLTLIAGDPGLGKSQVTVDLASIVSSGGVFPCGSICKEGVVLFFTAEDDFADTIVPRLHACNANLEKINLFNIVKKDGKEKGFDLGTDIELLEKALKNINDVALIVIDPITAYLGDTDSHVNAEVRALLSKLQKIAQSSKVAVVAVTHLNKTTTTSAINKITGSTAFVAASRAAYMVIKDEEDEDRRLFLTVKNNLGTDKGGFAYKLKKETFTSKSGRTIETSRVNWETGSISLSLADILKQQGKGGGRKNTTEWLKDFLQGYPSGVSFDVLMIAARREGFSRSSIYNASQELKIDKSLSKGKNMPKKWKLLTDEVMNDRDVPF
jgi:putative DNA primase/helicase